MHRICFSLAFASWILVPAVAQSFNIDFGDAASAPNSGYAAAGRAGVWNAYGVLPSYQNYPLVDIQGHATPTTIYMTGVNAMLNYNNSGTSGGDQALMDDMLLSYNDPTDACIWVANLVAGTYEVLIYAMTPNDSTLLSRVRVDSGDPGPVMVGGAWPGHHQEGVTYERFTVPISQGGTIGLHSGLSGGYIQSGINGFQIRRIIDCPGDVNDDDLCDLTDLAILLAHFGATGNATRADGDLDGNHDVDLNDLAILLGRFGSVCQ